MDCPRPIKSGSISILCHVVVANQALHEDTKVRGPGVEASCANHAQELTFDLKINHNSYENPLCLVTHMKILSLPRSSGWTGGRGYTFPYP